MAEQLPLEALRAQAAAGSATAAVEAADAVLSTVLQQPGGDALPDSLQLAAQLAADRQQWRLVAQVAVRLLVCQPGGADGQRWLAAAVQDAEGLAQVLSDFGGGAPAAGSPAGAAVVVPEQPAQPQQRAAALAHLAHVASRGGALHPAAAMFRQVLRVLAPGDSRCALHLAHTLEALGDYGGVLSAVLAFCRTNPHVELGAGARLGNVLGLTALHDLAQQGGGARQGSLAWWQQDQQQQQQQHQRPAVTAPAAAATAGSPAATSSAAVPALALLMTAAKVLFTGGALTAAAQLQALYAPAAAACLQHQLQDEGVRNEAAFSQLVRQLLEVPPQPLSPVGAASTALAPIFACGDSHVVPPAWRTVLVHGQLRLLVPLLVTGCKAWHVCHAACAAQPQQPQQAQQFWRLMQQHQHDGVPQDADVLLVLGEIDCREGLLRAVQRGKYASLAQAVAATAAAYAGSVVQLAASRAPPGRVLVHPVPPVLPETRPLVQAFNAELQQQLATAEVAAAAHAGGTPARVPLWLGELQAAWNQQPQLLEFDGAHLHPSYVASALQPALERALPLSGSRKGSACNT